MLPAAVCGGGNPCPPPRREQPARLPPRLVLGSGGIARAGAGAGSGGAGLPGRRRVSVFPANPREILHATMPQSWVPVSSPPPGVCGGAFSVSLSHVLDAFKPGGAGWEWERRLLPCERPITFRYGHRRGSLGLPGCPTEACLWGSGSSPGAPRQAVPFGLQGKAARVI